MASERAVQAARKIIEELSDDPGFITSETLSSALNAGLRSAIEGMTEERIREVSTTETYTEFRAALLRAFGVE